MIKLFRKRYAWKAYPKDAVKLQERIRAASIFGMDAVERCRDGVADRPNEKKNNFELAGSSMVNCHPHYGKGPQCTARSVRILQGRGGGGDRDSTRCHRVDLTICKAGAAQQDLNGGGTRQGRELPERV